MDNDTNVVMCKVDERAQAIIDKYNKKIDNYMKKSIITGAVECAYTAGYLACLEEKNGGFYRSGAKDAAMVCERMSQYDPKELEHILIGSYSDTGKFSFSDYIEIFSIDRINSKLDEFDNEKDQ